MMFDLTPTVPIARHETRAYWIARVVVFASVLVVLITVIGWVVFPDARGYFDYRVYFGARNTIASPRFVDARPVVNGRIFSGEPMNFNFSARGEYSQAEVRLTPEKAPHLDTVGTVEIVRSYRANLYPEGPPVTFRSGSLIGFQGECFLVSGGKTRRIISPPVLEEMGYDRKSCEEISEAEMQTLPRGDDILSAAVTPEGMIARVANAYFQFLAGQWVPFVSERAYRTQYLPGDAAVSKNALPGVSAEQMIGFASGTILSYGEAVYVVEGETLRPVDSAETYLTKGYDWRSVRAATGEEYGMYRRGKLYTIREPHPDGTLFSLPEEQALFMVDQGKRRPIRGEHLRTRFGMVTPVTVEERETRACQLRSTVLGDYFCAIGLGDLGGVGAEYQFVFQPEVDLTLQEMTTTLSRDVNRNNWEAFLTDLKLKLISRYGS